MKPDDIPEDVWATAERVWSDAYQMRRVGPANTLMPIARAILAEREANARKADEQAAREEYGHAKHACVTIAHNIRNGGG